jgi:hypothetical protein
MRSALELSLQTTTTNLSLHRTGQQARTRTSKTLAPGLILSRKLQPKTRSSSSLSETFRTGPGAEDRSIDQQSSAIMICFLCSVCITNANPRAGCLVNLKPCRREQVKKPGGKIVSASLASH